jgi:hypothetical protein
LPGPASIQCRFKGTRTHYLLTSGVTGVDDGAWHTATCWRTGGVVGVTVDGVAVQHLVDVGDITNRRALHVGGKALTAATDQFPGVLDYVAVAIGPGAELASRAGAPR